MNQVGAYPGVPLKVTERAVASAFRLLRLHPALSLVMVTEFPPTHMQLGRDLVSSYLAIPFGWNGSPARCARFGDAITMARMKCGLSPPNANLMLHSFRSVLYFDDGIFVEANVPGRLFATTQRWGHLTTGVLGREDINLDKLGEEGKWGSQQILLGFTFNLDRLAVTSPDGEIEGARLLPTTFSDMKGSKLVTMMVVQRRRGHLEHCQSTNEVWSLAKGPSYSHLGRPGEQGMYARRPDPTVWEIYRPSIEAIESRCQSEETWRALFKGEAIRSLKPEGRLSFKPKRNRAVRVSSGATLFRMAVISWGDKKASCVPTDVIRSLTGRLDYQVIIWGM